MIVPKAYKVPKEAHYNYGWDSKRQYPPLALQTLQLMIDTGGTYKINYNCTELDNQFN